MMTFLAEIYPLYQRPHSLFRALRLASVLHARNIPPTHPTFKLIYSWEMVNQRSGGQTEQARLKRDKFVDTLYIYQPPLNIQTGPYLCVTVMPDGEPKWSGMDTVEEWLQSLGG